MKNCTFLNVIALFLPSFASFSAIITLAKDPVETFYKENNKSLISSSLVRNNSFSTAIRSTNSKQRKNPPTPLFLAQRLLDGSGNELNPQGLDCNNIPFDAQLETPQGIEPMSIYCQTEFNHRQQLAANNQTKTSWQRPYWSNGNVCRDRGVETVCLTPQEAINLRWLTPSQELMN